MNKSELVDAVASETGAPKTKTAEMLDAMIKVITKALKKGDQVAITGFGTFKVSMRAARDGVNPATKAKIKIPARKAPKFTAGKTLKENVA